MTTQSNKSRLRAKINQAIMAETRIESGCGESFSLAQLAAQGTQEQAIQRGNLMERTRHMEEIATELGDVGMFVTLACPSKYHPRLAQSEVRNPAYDNSTPSPKEASIYLNRVWAEIKNKTNQVGIRPYGFRVCEPHSNGCPHWHMLLFVAPDQVDQCTDIMLECALSENGDEPGARNNRIKIERVDVNKGSSARYIAKYVSKNIFEEDTDGANNLDDEQDIQLFQQVAAWAAQWGIGQFKLIGTPPVIVWTGLRRIDSFPNTAASGLKSHCSHCTFNNLNEFSRGICRFNLVEQNHQFFRDFFMLKSAQAIGADIGDGAADSVEPVEPVMPHTCYSRLFLISQSQFFRCSHAASIKSGSVAE